MNQSIRKNAISSEMVPGARCSFAQTVTGFVGLHRRIGLHALHDLIRYETGASQQETDDRRNHSEDTHDNDNDKESRARIEAGPVHSAAAAVRGGCRVERRVQECARRRARVVHGLSLPLARRIQETREAGVKNRLSLTFRTPLSSRRPCRTPASATSLGSRSTRPRLIPRPCFPESRARSRPRKSPLRDSRYPTSKTTPPG